MPERSRTLEEYLSDSYNEDLQDIRTIDATLVAIAKTYVATFDTGKGYWPLDVTAQADTTDARRSHGTSAMILSALGKMLGTCIARNDRHPVPLRGGPHDLQTSFDRGLNTLFGQLEADKKCVSTTFGDNDPLTISHVAELVQALGASRYKDRAEAVLKQIQTAKSRIEKLAAEDPADMKAFSAALQQGANVRWSSQNAFLALRILRAHADMSGHSHVRSERFRRFFEAHIHQQLSFSSIPDSRFDPAELAFCLEGLLICAEEAVDPLLFGRVLSVLRANQETSAYWRPNRPFADRPTGEIMLPLSVEGANSLLRATEMLDKSKLHGTFAGQAVPMFRRFWQWLRARKVEFDAMNERCVGWHSEHINNPAVIHLWDTSQVVEFLIAFRAMLQRHIARETLVLSRVKVEEPEQASWQVLASRYEPLSEGTQIRSARVFDRVYSDFVQPWTEQASDRNYSMLLYGPPGTGKTTLAKSIAYALSFRLITITVSDFLGAGGALVEARAKAIFEMLEAQTNCVVFFDEIDAFLLDRDSELYRKQDTLFQFLTPGMLTKINDLRECQRAIFIIATNYENRIDPAIKRTGRIDKRYLLLPPDLKKRESILKDLHASNDAPLLERMAKAAVYLSYKDIKASIESADSPDGIVENLSKNPRSNGYDIYLRRLSTESTFPYLEFLACAEMAQEAGLLDDLKSSLTRLSPDDKKAWESTLQKSPSFQARLEELGVV